MAAKQAGGVGGGRRDEAAAKNEEHEGFDKENQIKRIELTVGYGAVGGRLRESVDSSWVGRRHAEVV